MNSPLDHPRPQNPWNIPPPLNIRKHPGQVFPLRSPTHHSRVERSAYICGPPRVTVPLLIGLAERVLYRPFDSARRPGTTKTRSCTHSVAADSLFSTTATTAPLSGSPSYSPLRAHSGEMGGLKVPEKKPSALEEPRGRVVPQSSDSGISR